MQKYNIIIFLYMSMLRPLQLAKYCSQHPVFKHPKLMIWIMGDNWQNILELSAMSHD
jgi:hypothetical protein